MQQSKWTPYCGAAPDPDGLLGQWNWDPLILTVLALAGWWGIIRTAGRMQERKWVVLALFFTFLLFVSPFCALTSALFAARSVHHLAIVLILAPILVAASPRLRVSGGPALWAAVSATTLWLWHVPQFYAAALSVDLLYWVMQASLLGTAIGFWAALRSASHLGAVAALLASMVQMGFLGALLTFAQTAFYAPHALTTSAWGLSPLEDQQLAGLLMWVPGALPYLLTALLRVHLLMGDEVRPIPEST